MALSRILALMANYRRIEFVGTAGASNDGSTSQPITFPAGARVGDLAIVTFTYGGFTGVNFPSGYTVLSPVPIENATHQGAWVGYKVLTSGDLSSPSSIMNGGGFGSLGAILCTVYRGVTTVTQKSAVADATGNITLSGFTPAGNTKAAFSFVSDRDATMSGQATTSGWTNRATQQGGAFYGIAVADQFAYVSGSVTWSGFNSGDNRVEGGALYELT